MLFLVAISFNWTRIKAELSVVNTLRNFRAAEKLEFAACGYNLLMCGDNWKDWTSRKKEIIKFQAPRFRKSFVFLLQIPIGYAVYRESYKIYGKSVCVLTRCNLITVFERVWSLSSCRLNLRTKTTWDRIY